MYPLAASIPYLLVENLELMQIKLYLDSSVLEANYSIVGNLVIKG